MSEKETASPQISAEEAIRHARRKVAGLTYIDPQQVENPVFSSRARALAVGVGDGPNVRDTWLVSFARVPTGHMTDGMFDSLMVVVDAETGEATIQDSL